GFNIPGRLEKCFVDEGDKVTKGQLLARLEIFDQKIALALVEANLARAESVLSELMAGSRPEEIEQSHARVVQARQMLLELERGSRVQVVESAASKLKAAKIAMESAGVRLVQAKADYDRFTKLYKKNSASRREFELFRTKYELARNTANEAGLKAEIARQELSVLKQGPRAEKIERAKAALLQAGAEYELVKKGPRKEKIQQAKARVNEVKATLSRAEQQLSYTRLVAPMDGVVLTRSAEPGEYLNPSAPVLVLADLQHPWLRAYVTEKDLGRIRLKDKVKVSTDSFPGKNFKGTITFISSRAEFTPKSVQTFEERVKLMFRIKVQLPNPQGELKPGMPADGVISSMIPQHGND
ncbi:MAG: HlyD family efflux transporter periplasmic adaptor subunit, partial [Deltaproteobacteria bacterium]|nr:HlyD family efflux transporter periplasmic adaptor subunit [Deltaproteobacteria bacterium]